VGVGGEEFVDAVMAEFRKMYGDAAGQGVVVGEDEALANEEVVKGVRELVSPDWIFGQTPQFTFSTHPTEEDPRERPEVVHTLPYGVSVFPLTRLAVLTAPVQNTFQHPAR
jgi:lipoate-protein ligase A